jgi:hypothetical protein
MDRQISELDKQLRVLNFGQPITHSFMEQYMPDRIKKANDVDAYRDWKQSEIYLKMSQL